MPEACVYCGGVADTEDHVPPHCFLEVPEPHPRITVPACFKCNNGSSLDEQYAIAMLSQIGATEALEAKVSSGGKVDRAFVRSPAFEQRFIDRLHVDDVGNVFLEPERDRLDAVLKKVVAGLYWHRYRRRVELRVLGPIDYWPLADPRAVPAHIFVSTFTERFRPKSWKTIQPGVFAYLFCRLGDGSLACVIRWHETLWITCVVPQPGRGHGKARTPAQEPLPLDLD